MAATGMPGCAQQPGHVVSEAVKSTPPGWGVARSYITTRSRRKLWFVLVKRQRSTCRRSRRSTAVHGPLAITPEKYAPTAHSTPLRRRSTVPPRFSEPGSHPSIVTASSSAPGRVKLPAVFWITAYTSSGFVTSGLPAGGQAWKGAQQVQPNRWPMTMPCDRSSPRMPV